MVEACGELSKMKASYKMGGKRHIREAINNFLEYIAIYYRDSFEMYTDVIIDDILDSPKLLPCIEAVIEVLHKLNKRLSSEPKLFALGIEVRKLIRAYPNESKKIIDPLDENGHIKSNETIQREYDEMQRHSKRRDEDFYRKYLFSDILAKNEGNVEKAWKEFGSLNEYNDILKNSYELRDKSGLKPCIDPVGRDGKIRDLKDIKEACEEHLKSEQERAARHQREDRFNDLLVKYKYDVEKAYNEFKALYITV